MLPGGRHKLGHLTKLTAMLSITDSSFCYYYPHLTREQMKVQRYSVWSWQVKLHQCLLLSLHSGSYRSTRASCLPLPLSSSLRTTRHSTSITPVLLLLIHCGQAANVLAAPRKAGCPKARSPNYLGLYIVKMSLLL